MRQAPSASTRAWPLASLSIGLLIAALLFPATRLLRS